MPNDILLYRKDLDKNSVNKIKIALSENSDEMINAILVGEDNKSLYGMNFFTSIQKIAIEITCDQLYKTIGIKNLINL